MNFPVSFAKQRIGTIIIEHAGTTLFFSSSTYYFGTSGSSLNLL
jgi:hypothetical protein